MKTAHGPQPGKKEDGDVSIFFSFSPQFPSSLYLLKIWDVGCCSHLPSPVIVCSCSVVCLGVYLLFFMLIFYSRMALRGKWEEDVGWVLDRRVANSDVEMRRKTKISFW